MDEYPKPVTKECTKKILEQMNNMNNLIYGIYDKNIEQLGTCFFCLIKYNNLKIPVMIASYQKLIKYLLNNCKGVDILINNELFFIEFGNAKYINNNYDLLIIQIKENKDIHINYLIIDDDIYEKELETYFYKESIYIINYNNINDISVSYGLINYINNSEIIYSGYKNFISETSLIFHLNNNKLIGFNPRNSKYYNKGIFLKFFINEFINIYQYSNINKNALNEIDLYMRIIPEEINKDIYFLNKSNLNNNLK